MAILLPFTSKGTGYTDLTGRFPYKSARGNQYIMVLYDYDSNSISAIATKTRYASDLTRNSYILEFYIHSLLFVSF